MLDFQPEDDGAAKRITFKQFLAYMREDKTKSSARLSKDSRRSAEERKKAREVGLKSFGAACNKSREVLAKEKIKRARLRFRGRVIAVKAVGRFRLGLRAKAKEARGAEENGRVASAPGDGHSPAGC